METMTLILDVRQQCGYVATLSVFIFKLPAPFSEIPIVTLQPARTLAISLCMHFLGISRADIMLIFLHQNSWVSSIDTLAFDKKEYVQHFFVPSEFITSTRDVLPI